MQIKIHLFLVSLLFNYGMAMESSCSSKKKHNQEIESFHDNFNLRKKLLKDFNLTDPLIMRDPSFKGEKIIYFEEVLDGKSFIGVCFSIKDITLIFQIESNEQIGICLKNQTINTNNYKEIFDKFKIPYIDITKFIPYSDHAGNKILLSLHKDFFEREFQRFLFEELLDITKIQESINDRIKRLAEDQAKNDMEMVKFVNERIEKINKIGSITKNNRVYNLFIKNKLNIHIHIKNYLELDFFYNSTVPVCIFRIRVDIIGFWMFFYNAKKEKINFNLEESKIFLDEVQGELSNDYKPEQELIKFMRTEMIEDLYKLHQQKKGDVLCSMKYIKDFNGTNTDLLRKFFDCLERVTENQKIEQKQ
jgi:hypothetical protein